MFSPFASYALPKPKPTSAPSESLPREFINELFRIMIWPCLDHLDHILISYATEWISPLNYLTQKEVTSPTHQMGMFRRDNFQDLQSMVFRVRNLISCYYIGIDSAFKTPLYHKTFFPAVPRSDVAQARVAIAILIIFGFGAWLERIASSGRGLAVGSNIHSFYFDKLRGIIGWGDLQDGHLAYASVPRVRLYLIYPPEPPASENIDSGANDDQTDGEYDSAYDSEYGSEYDGQDDSQDDIQDDSQDGSQDDDYVEAESGPFNSPAVDASIREWLENTADPDEMKDPFIADNIGRDGFFNIPYDPFKDHLPGYRPNPFANPFLNPFLYAPVNPPTDNTPDPFDDEYYEEMVADLVSDPI
ncbi:uncharacterized protein GGS25DRAFT_461293 [Hypoxylon fragiforme]|uniref:uncharacterized protein n=1 Tax=Hypoxylon fragiforme TaxID=63214 RepID=UPI0020C5F75A|nr:uncharacterized protein GGS25DRAFT_461293 [Hypoxylon fragiforme]KAI2604439.1 hypothetical protein GGS25DRAFT_461293 [Hypoxylon fragiforme]